jgi:hypothetical protein
VAPAKGYSRRSTKKHKGKKTKEARRKVEENKAKIEGEIKKGGKEIIRQT